MEPVNLETFDTYQEIFIHYSINFCLREFFYIMNSFYLSTEAENYQYYAHSKRTEQVKDWQTLMEHLEGTAVQAQKFASSFGADSWARTVSLLHDLGKARQSFKAISGMLMGLMTHG